MVAQDEPITGRLLLDGCRGSDGMIVPIPYYPCRGSGNVVAGFVYRGRGWSGELRLAWEEKPLAQGTYGTWRGGYVFTGDEYLDVAGCVITWPDLIEPSPS